MSRLIVLAAIVGLSTPALADDAAAPASAPSRGLPELALHWAFGGDPLGPEILARPGVLFRAVTGVDTVGPGGPGAVTGLVYEERGGFLAGLVGLGLAGASAQETANRTGTPTRIRGEGAFAPNLGITVTTLTGGTPQAPDWRVLGELFIAVPYFELFDRMAVLDFALAYGQMTRAGQYATTAGVTLRTSIPVTAFGSLDASFLLDALGNSGSEARFGGSGYVWNRFVVSAHGIYGQSGLGGLVSAGVRL